MSDEPTPALDADTQREVAKKLNNRAWDLLGNTERTPAEDRELVHATHASLWYWLQVGTALNEQRGEWLISHAYAVLGKGAAALEHAQRCLELTEELSLDGFDRGYAYEAMARAHAALGEGARARQWHARAAEIGATITDEEDRVIFTGDLDAPPWFGTGLGGDG